MACEKTGHHGYGRKVSAGQDPGRRGHCNMRSYENSQQVFDELSGQIYAALREGVLDAEPVVELARLLEEWGQHIPAVREVLERSTAHPLDVGCGEGADAI
jgi:hypothetical protein